MDRKDKDLEFLRGMEKLKAADVRSPDYTSDLDKDVIPVKGGKTLPEPVTRIPGATQKINTRGVSAPLVKGEDFVEKIASLRASNAAKKLGKKALGVIPFAGAAYGLASGDPAMAAEEAAGDIPLLGQAYEAVRPDVAGNPEEEMQMLAERNASEDYRNSPAAAARKAALMKLR